MQRTLDHLLENYAERQELALQVRCTRSNSNWSKLVFNQSLVNQLLVKQSLVNQVLVKHLLVKYGQPAIELVACSIA